jgi:MFS family permease
VLPSIIGPAVAGALADHWTWRAVFLAVPPLVVPAVLLLRQRLASLVVPPSQVVRRRGRKRLALAAALGAVLLQYAGQRLDWSSLALLVVAALLLAASVPRLMPAGTLRVRRGLPTAVALRGLFAGAFFGAEAFVPLMLVEQRGLATTLAGLSLTGGALGWAFGSWWQGRPGLRTPRPRLILVGSLIVSAGIACAALTVLDAVPALVAALAWAVAGAGMGMAMASVSVLLLELSPVADQGANSAALQLADGFGSIVFIGIAGAIFTTFRAGPGASAGAFAGILLTMAVVALLAALVAPRINPRADPDTP